MLQPITEIDGLPLFKITQDLEGTQEEAIEEIFDAGYVMFYLLASKKMTTSWTDSKKKKQTYVSYRPTIFKVVKNFIGSGVAEFDSDIEELDAVSGWAKFTLPPIPAHLMDKIDRLFRHIDRTLGTEAVVLFTYDPEYKDSESPEEGWGILVPEQNNTSGSCDYDPSSVMEDKPDHVRIVGTAHSHPQMDAFCSGTDKGDQMGFDGVHITFGWKGNSATQFHCEVQMADYGFGAFKDGDIFENPKAAAVDDEIIDWAKNVKKRHYHTNGSATTTSNTTVTTLNAGVPWDDPRRYPNLPAGCPSPRAVTLVWYSDISSDELETCPVCDHNFSEYTKKSQKCSNCSVYIVGADQDWDSFKKKRKEETKSSVMELEEETATKPIWMVDAILGVVEVFEGKTPIPNLKFAEGDGTEEESFNDALDDEWICITCKIPNNIKEDFCWMCSDARVDTGIAT